MDLTLWTAANRANWDDRARAHLADQGEFYPLDHLRAGGSTLLPLERELLGDVRGLRLLHLMCHIGHDSVSWARLGARVTAIDLSPESIAGARTLARECGVEVDFHVGDIGQLPPACAGPFDVVAMTYGVLCWIADLAGLMRDVAARLAPSGRFLLIDGHPLQNLLPADPAAEGYRVEGDEYFHRPEPDRQERATSYSGQGRLAHPVSYQWCHGVGDIAQGVIGAGLQLRALREERYGFYQRYPGMARRADGTWSPPPGMPGLPMVLGLLAERPAA